MASGHWSGGTSVVVDERKVYGHAAPRVGVGAPSRPSVRIYKIMNLVPV